VLNPANGLRFDVYERVHLPVDVADIHELEEIELTPHIQVVHQDEQVLLRGNLLLSGAYASQGETRESRTLTHWIPVEITLPLSRVRSLADIRVEVENFDVDLLSARTLNITGVLSLKGVEAREPEASAAPAWVDEPFTVVHRREPEPQEPQEPAAAGPEGQRAEETNGLEPVQWSSEAFFQQAEEDRDPAELEAALAAADRGQEEPATDEGSASRTDASLDASSAPQSDASAEFAGYAAESPVEPVSDRPDSAEAQQADQAEEQQTAELSEDPASLPEPIQAAAVSEITGQEAEPAKPDLKIALGAKKPESPSGKQEAFGLSTLLQSNRREQEVRQAAAEEEQAKQQAEAAALASAQGEEIEWKSLFLSRDPNAEAFRKVRMCIVQRDDTLDAIAGRYQLNPRELVLYNRLAEHEVSEGQVLLIP